MIWYDKCRASALLFLAFQPAALAAGDGPGFGTQLAEDLQHGEAVLRTFSWIHGDNSDDPSFPVELRVRQRATLDVSSRLRLVLSPEYRVDNRHFTSGVIDELVEEQERRYAVNLRDAYLELSLEHFGLIIGKKIWAWGTADGYNPTDNLNPSDFLDFLLSEKIGVPSVAATWTGLASSFELVLLPYFTPARLPGEGNRWAIELDSSLFPEPGPMEPGRVILPTGRVLPDKSFDNAQLAARFKTSLAGTDVELSYFHGFDSIPVGEIVAVHPLPTSPPSLGIEVAAVYNEIDEIGLALASTLGQLAWHLEASYRFTAKGYDDDFLTWVLGINKSWYVGQAVEELRLTLEYVDEAFVREATESRRFSTDFNRPFQDSLLAHLVLQVHQDFTVGLKTAYNVRDHDYFIEPTLTYRLDDHHQVEIGAHLIDGDPGTLWGNWPDNDRLYTYFTLFF